jgi:hypothetical protein
MAEDKTPSDQVRWAFDIHKDADALLHTRLQGFLAFNALLSGGFFLTERGVHEDHCLAILAALGPILGFFIGLLFLAGTERLVKGINALKDTYLLKDPVYETYYGAKKRPRVSYWFAVGAPLWLLVFWAAALTYSIFHSWVFWSSVRTQVAACLHAVIS